jgi:hypothetical protein
MLTVKDYLLSKAENMHISWAFNAVEHFAQINGMDTVEAIGFILSQGLKKRGFNPERYEPGTVKTPTNDIADYWERTLKNPDTGVKARIIPFRKPAV